MTHELKSCPFCGGEAKHIATGIDDHEMDFYHEIFCCTCGATTDNPKSKAEAIELWNRRASPPPPVEVGEGIIPDLDLLSEEERRGLLTKAENLWSALQDNDLGGFSGINRPFYILSAFKEVIEDFGKRNAGYRHSKNQIDAHRAALAAIGGHDD